MPPGTVTPRALVGLAAVTLALAGCEADVTDATPEGAVRLFIEAMARGQGQQAAIRDAFQLLDGPARRELGRRAERASTLSGRRFHPWDMIPQGRFRLRFRPRDEDGYRTAIEGDRATVTVLGEEAGQRADVPLVRENGRWRIVLPVPGAARGGASAADGSAAEPAGAR